MANARQSKTKQNGSGDFDRETANKRKAREHRTYTREMALDIFDAAGLLVNEATGRCQDPFDPGAEEKANPSIVISEGDDGKLLFFDHRDRGRPFKDWVDWMDEFLDGNEVAAVDRAPQKTEKPELPSIAECKARERRLSGSRAYTQAGYRGIEDFAFTDHGVGACRNKPSESVMADPPGTGGASYPRLSIPTYDSGGYAGIVASNPTLGKKPYRPVLAIGPRQLFPAPEFYEGGRVILCEGELDALAVYSRGHQVVGVPGANTWKGWGKRFAHFESVRVMFDCDKAGRAGAVIAAGDIARFVADTKIVDLDPSRDDGYDLGDVVMGNE